MVHLGILVFAVQPRVDLAGALSRPLAGGHREAASRHRPLRPMASNLHRYRFGLGWGAIGGVMALAAYSDDGWGPLILGLIMGGIWVLISLVGLTALTIALALPGTSGPNRYGPDLLRPESADNSVPQSAPATEFSPGAGGSARSVDDQASPDISAGPDAPARQYCIQCGTQLQQDARFCVSCGTPI